MGIDQKLGDSVPLDLAFRDEAGSPVRLGQYFGGKKPVLLSLVYYRCPGLCTMTLNGMAAAFKPMKYTLSGRQQRTFKKLIVEAATDKVVGIHMVGDDAAELVQGLAVAVKAGATKAQFDATVGIHPTAGEEFVTMRTARVEPAPRQKAAE